MFANRVVNATVAALNIFAASVPTVAFSIVVEARVDEPVFTKFCEVRFPDTVVDPVLREVRAAFPAEIFPRVVEAKVEEAEAMKFCAFEVVALVVVANKVVIFPVVAKKFPKIALVKFARVAKKLVEVEFVIVELTEVKFVFAMFVETRFVLVALVRVALITSIAGKEIFETERLVIVAFVKVELADIKLFVFTRSPAIFCPVKFEIVVEARVDEPETLKFVKKADSELKIEAKKFVEVA